MKLPICICIVCGLLWHGVSFGETESRDPASLTIVNPHGGSLSFGSRYGMYVDTHREYSLSATYSMSGNIQGAGHETARNTGREYFSLCHVSDSTALEYVLVCQGTSGQRSQLHSDETMPSGELEQADQGIERVSNRNGRVEATGMIYRSPGKRWLRGQGLVGGFYLSCMGILLLLPESVSRWEGDFWSEAGENLSRAWTEPPVWDSDKWYLNYIAHPYCGALAYNLMRSQGGGRFESFVFGVIQSCLYEYVVEAVAEQPSIQDLIVTPVAGAILGELIHYATLRMSADGRFSLLEKILVTIINPCWVVNNRYIYKDPPGYIP